MTYTHAANPPITALRAPWLITGHLRLIYYAGTMVDSLHYLLRFASSHYDTVTLNPERYYHAMDFVGG